jgi:diadenosine tetraphosphate (Ap4A) HIT family hydrolase
MDYEKFKIQDYDYWSLYLHQEQYPYIGRCYVVHRYEDFDNILFLDSESDHTTELFQVVIPDWFKAVSKLYKADWPNVAFLGNDWRHLHFHLIPRYWQKHNFFGIEFEDPQPTKNYAPYPKRALGEDILQQIKQQIQETIPLVRTENWWSICKENWGQINPPYPEKKAK